jgi:hypothetical protein
MNSYVLYRKDYVLGKRGPNAGRGLRIFVLQNAQPCSGVYRVSVKRVPAFCSPGVKWPGHEFCQSSPPTSVLIFPQKISAY